MTKLTKPVHRETASKVFSSGKEREVIVILQPPGTLGFRLKGTKTTYWLPADRLYMMALQAEQAGK